MMFSSLLFAIQAVFLAFFLSSTTYSYESDEFFKDYIKFRDIMAMLLLGFGYLMTFLKAYGLGAVGLTLFLTMIAMQANIALEFAMRALYTHEEDWPAPVTMAVLIDAEFAAATLLISFGALIGRASPLQMLGLTLSQAVFYAFNKVILVLGYIEAEDVGGTITIHMFGAYFGLAASYALGAPEDDGAEQDKISDIFAFVGTTILWVFWPSFVAATETTNSDNEMRCIVNTVLALMASTTAAFYTSHKLTHGKFDPVHIANSTLAGGVAIGASARLDIGPGNAILLGLLAGVCSVVGYVHSSPFLEAKFSIYDTCGVGNLHGIPSILGGLASMIFVAVDPSADFLEHSVGSQVLRQLGAVVATLLVSIVSGYGTGKLIGMLKDDEKASYKDNTWWHAEYFDASVQARSDPSVH
jgi:ammonium transporter Rh